MRILNLKKHYFTSGFCLVSLVQISAQEPINNKNQDSIVNVVIENIAFQPQEEATITIHEDPRIKRLLAIKTDMDKKGELNDNYRIQLYYGNSNEANKILKKAQEEFPQWSVDIVYQTPNFKVWLGNYRNKLDVDRALKEVSKVFPGAFSFKPDK